MVKYATAIKNGTASTEAVLSRFTGAASHPAYQAMLEVGKAQRTLFVARYLFDRDLQRQIEQGLNVVESWNRANAIICYGKSGEISTNQREEVEMTALCLRILQASLVFVNTLMLQDVLAEPEWSALLTPVDRRGLSPLFWQHVRPYLDTLQNRYGPGPAVSRADPIPEAVGGQRRDLDRVSRRMSSGRGSGTAS